MQKLNLNKIGASLIEIVATITIVSIALLMIYSILSNIIRQNGVNQEKSINANVANSALSYMKGLDFSIINTYLGNEDYMIVNGSNCSSFVPEDSELCNTVLNPVINNKKYSELNLNIYILPYNDPYRLQSLKSLPIESEIFEKYVYDLDISEFSPVNINNNAIRIVIVVNSSINERHDFLLDGVTTND